MNALLILTVLTLIRIVIPIAIVLSLGEYTRRLDRRTHYHW